ncbi:MAG: cadmium-translocating P-type ATPase [Lachnospiraceae bacterium]|nr:cadmium-translocating P-type ATPase [Lachnospiraceae bacterium]
MTKKQKKRLYRIVISLVLFVILLVLNRVTDFEKLPEVIKFAIYLVPYLIVGYDVIIKAGKNIINGQVFDENFLMMIATFAAFGLGIFGDGQYDEALAVMLFYQIGELFQDYAVGQSRKSITEMMNIAPEYANVERNGEVTEEDPEDVHVGDIIVIKPGEKIPLDGVIIEGETFLDTKALTGESVPRKVKVSEAVISGCINGEGTIRVKVSKEYEDSTVAKILDLVENASSKKAKIENFITRFAKYYTPVVTISAVVLAIFMPLLFNVSWADGIKRACNFLIVSCPCALVISVPLGFFGGIGAASKIGVLVKGSNFLEIAADAKVIVMDKTGTLTKGEFKVSDLITNSGVTKDELIEMAAYGENYSNHPIAKSIKNEYNGQIDNMRLSDAKEISGHGISVKFDGRELLAGNEKLLKENNIGFDRVIKAGTLVYIAYDGKYEGCIVISDTVKDGAESAVKSLRKSGVEKTVMLTGDRKDVAEEIAVKLGIDEVRSELLPGDKVDCVEKIIEKYSGKNSKVVFVGDGINDAPVLMRADLGIAMGSLGSDAAIEAADIVLMDDDIRKIPKVIKIARKTKTIVRTNVAFALTVKLLILVLSAFGLVGMWAAVFGDVGVSVICIINSMRALKQ